MNHSSPSLFRSKHLVHGLVRQLYSQKGCRVGRDSTSQRGTETREEGLVAALAVELANDASDGDVALGGLKAGFHGVDREDGNPHGDTGTGTGARHGRQAQLAGGLSGDGVLGAEVLLDDLVGGEVGGASGPVAGEGGDAAAEDGAQAALAVELAHDVEAAAVLWLLAGRELLLALDLQDDLDALKGGGDGRHGDGGEEAGGGELAGGQAFGPNGRDAADDLLAEIVAPEGHGDCGFAPLVSSHMSHLTHKLVPRFGKKKENPKTKYQGQSKAKGKKEHTHGRNANQRRTDTRIQAPSQSIPRDRLAHHINGARVDAALGRLQAHLDQVERVADDDGADASEAAGRQGAQLRQESGLGGGRGGLGGLFGLLGRGDLVGDGGDCLGGGGA